MAGVRTKQKVTTKEDLKEFFELPDKKVEIRYIRRQRGLIRDKRHVAYGGLLDGASITLPAMKQRNGQYANVLTNAEKDFLENILGLEENGLSVYKKDGFWKDLKIRLTKESIYLNLNDPVDYIKYKTLLAYKDLVAPNLKSIEPEYDKQTYRFVIVEEGEEVTKKLNALDVQKEAYKFFGKIEDDRDAMIDFLLVAGKRVASNIDTKALKAKVGQMVEEKPAEVVEIMGDSHYYTKVLIKTALKYRIVTEVGGKYFTDNKDPLAKPGTLSTYEEAIRFLEDPENSEVKLYLKAKIDERKRVQ